jgi:hypothetical protein
MNGYPYRNKNLNGFWDDNLETPTVYLEDDVSSAEINIPNMEPTGIDSTGGSGWDLSFSDILKAGTSIAQEVIRYKTATLPGGQRIYTSIDPRTGRPYYGGNTIAMGDGISQFVNRNLPMLALAGVGVLLLTMNTGGKKK